MNKAQTLPRYAFIKASWHASITSRALEGFTQRIPAAQVDVFDVPGAFEMPLLARDLAASTAAIVIYKMGEHGAFTFADGAETRTGIYPVTALKPTGAGDSFMAGLLTGIADGLDLKAAVLRGSACAAIVVAKPGCAPAMPASGWHSCAAARPWSAISG